VAQPLKSPMASSVRPAQGSLQKVWTFNGELDMVFDGIGFLQKTRNARNGLPEAVAPAAKDSHPPMTLACRRLAAI
jgi:hypothetical protein